MDSEHKETVTSTTWLSADLDKSVLIVDDAPVIVTLLTALLEKSGYKVLSAKDGKEALQVLEDFPCAVAIIDKNLPPGLNGIDVLREARSRYPFLHVIIYTAHPSTESAIEALQYGAFDYVPKPSNHAYLIEKVNQAFGSYLLARERDVLFRNYETLFESVPSVVWFISEEGLFKRISRRGANLLGYSPQELVGKSYKTLLDTEAESSAIWTFLERRTGERGSHRQVVTLRTKSGKRRVFEVSSTATYEETKSGGKKYRGSLAVGWDITDQLNLLWQLQQKSKMDALGRLAGGVAHDINNILSVILNNVEFIRSSIPEDDAQQSDLEEIQTVGRRASQLTKQLLTFSRQEIVEPKPIRLGSSIENVKMMLKRTMREDIHLDVKVAFDLGVVKADPLQIEQVLFNLSINAIDAMPNGGSLSIQAMNANIDEKYTSQHPNLTPGEYVILSVSDSGQGMDGEVRERIFEPFFTTKEAGSGTGLGMSIVYGIVRQSGGHITIHSENELGTLIKVYLPRVQQLPEQETEISIFSSYSGSETILVVEDEASVRRVAKRILERSGYRVVEASNGKEAWEASLQMKVIDLLLTDVIMPVMSGAELALELRRQRARLPIIYLSGYLGNLLGKHRLLTDRVAFIQKPFTSRGLLEQTRKLLDSAA